MHKQILKKNGYPTQNLKSNLLTQVQIILATILNFVKT